ncbi:MAG: MBL fold metallo-hydrolase [Chloroflexota bacterium]
MNIVNVGYDSTNYYVLADKKPLLLVDVGWPGTLAKLQHQCQRMNIALTDIQHFLITHYHPDHAGLAQELRQMGSKLIVIDFQIAAIPAMRSYMKPQNHYVEIDVTDTVQLSLADSSSYLATLGIEGKIIATPGHSDDSVTLILEDGSAFTGDLTHPAMIEDDPTSLLYQSWEKIRVEGVKTIYPGHGPIWQLP